MEIIQPYITSIVEALVGILVTLILFALASLRKRVNKWIESRTTASQREILHKLAIEAFSLAETAFPDGKGKQKYSAAYNYFTGRLNEYGIDIGEAEIRAIIERSVLDYNAVTKSATGEKK